MTNIKKRILMLTIKFRHSDGSMWLSSELAYGLVSQGYEIAVLNLDWSGQCPESDVVKMEGRLKIFNYRAIRLPGKHLSLASRWIASSLKLLPILFKWLLTGKRYDLFITFSPCTSLYSVIPFAHLLSKSSFLLYWDFFPIHNQEISGKIPTFLMSSMRYLENKLVHSFSRVGCMSEKNVEFYKNYFGIGRTQEIMVTPVWTSILDYYGGSREEVRGRYSISIERVVFVFGGQLVEGRGIIEACEAAVCAASRNPGIMLVICGEGSLAERVREYEKAYPLIIKYIGAVPRSEYLDVVNSSDVGVVSTVEGVSVPTFPSKSLDYMACRLPILASVENVSDFGSIVERAEMGLSCPAGDIEAFAESMVKIISDKKRMEVMGYNANRHLKSHHSISNLIGVLTGGDYV